MSASLFKNKRCVVVGVLFVQLILSNSITTSSEFTNKSSKATPDSKTNQVQSTKATQTPTTGQPATVSNASESKLPMSAEPSGPTTMRVPSEQEINEARRIIHEVAATMKDGANRTDKPPGQAQEFAPESPEARVADATTRLGLNFIGSLPGVTRENTVVSPVSLQILLNIILLGTDDGSATQAELAKVLGYEANNLFHVAPKNESSNSTEESRESDRAQPHVALKSVIDSIFKATHPAIDEQEQLLNSNSQIAAHLQTTARDGDSTSAGQVNFTLANLMLTNEDRIRNNPDYVTDLKHFYDIKLEHFSTSKPKGAANRTDTKPLHERINSWVQNVTHKQISELLKESDVSDPDLALVLLNAAHFKGRWLHTFNSKLTQERAFYNEGQKTDVQEVKFMRQSGVFGYAEFGTSAQMLAEQQMAGQTSTSDETVLTEDLANGRTNDKAASETASPPVIELSKEEAKRFELTSNLNCSALMMPFSLNDGQELSMVILLPAKRDGLNNLLTNLNAPALNEIYRSLNEQHVQVELPKFSFESSFDAKTTLLKSGLTKVFQDGAELGRMLSSDSPKGLAKVDKIVHKAKIAVDEEGAEAAAASAATIVLRNLIRPPNPTFVADHPFLFVIRHNRSNLPLFMGAIQRL